MDRPHDWDKAVSAAFFWLICDEKRATAESAGVSERTIHRWTRSDWWPEACREAEGRWLQHLEAEARRTVLRSVQAGDSSLAMRILERRDRQLAPRPQEHRIGIFALLAQLPPSEISRLESMDDEELAEEMKRLESSD